ncbi:uncharacterized protein NPIL_230121 [Nephila pilipes]|uniref:Uncharacterized protein n=1 Tax=Nephila pilipes TaxID=299642 RepID=A0A8X6K510_NEPPI|nr:uncharacterized protein NPIL_230121 [Nephila pilipes]
MDYCAEVSWVRCMNGCRLPMEVAFARIEKPREVYILQMRMPCDVFFTVNDLISTKSLTKRAACQSIYKVVPKCIVKMEKDTWCYTIQQFVHDRMGFGARIAVRSKTQKKFFKGMCGFQNTQIVKIQFGQPAYGCVHKHSRIIPFPCAAKEARTMAHYLNKMNTAVKPTEPIEPMIVDEPMDESAGNIDKPMDESAGNADKPLDVSAENADKPMDESVENAGDLVEIADGILDNADYSLQNAGELLKMAVELLKNGC